MKLVQFERYHILAICEEINDRRLDNKIWESCLEWNEIAEKGEDLLVEWPTVLYDMPYFRVTPFDWKFGSKEHCVKIRIEHPSNLKERSSTDFYLWRENEDDEFPILLKELR